MIQGGDPSGTGEGESGRGPVPRSGWGKARLLYMYSRGRLLPAAF